MKSPTVSVIVLTKNAGKRFDRLLKGLAAQNRDDWEAVVIDSGSDDETLDIAKQHPVSVVEIAPEQFGHGKTRNFGAQIASGRYLVFLTHDAVPRGRNWLAEMIEPLSDPGIAGVYARQVPRANADLTDRAFYLSLYPTERKIWRADNWSEGDNIFSNVSSAMRKDLLQEYPFNEQILVSEDYEWAKRVIKNGFSIVYNPAAEVVHSHSYNLRSLFRRNFDIGESYKSIYPPGIGIGTMVGRGLRIHATEINYLIKQRSPHLVPYCVAKDLTRFVALKIGRYSSLLPRALRRWLSNYDEYWG